MAKGVSAYLQHQAAKLVSLARDCDDAELKMRLLQLAAAWTKPQRSSEPGSDLGRAIPDR